MNTRQMYHTPVQKKPWYLVPGRVDLTEKRISTKYENDARRQRQWLRAHNYFSEASARVDKLKKWEARTPRPLVDSPPFDCHQVNQRKLSIDVDPVEVKRIHDELTLQLDHIERQNQQYELLKQKSIKLIEYIETIREIAAETQNELNKQDTKLRRVQCTRSTRDELVCQVFIIVDKVSNLDFSIQLVEKLVNTNVFSPRECQELRCILDEAKGLLHTLLSINNSRQLQMTRMYSEEADRMRDQLVSQWEEEETMCLTLFNQIIDVFHSTLVTKLRLRADERCQIVLLREKALDDLTKYVPTLQSDTVVWNFLSNSSSFRIDLELNEHETLIE